MYVQGNEKLNVYDLGLVLYKDEVGVASGCGLHYWVTRYCIIIRYVNT